MENPDGLIQNQWFKTGYKGVQYQPHPTRRHGVAKDKYFRAQYQANGKRYTVGFGWASAGKSARGVFNKVQEYQQNAKMGVKPRTPKEEAEINEAKMKAEEAEKRRIEKALITFDQFYNNIYLPYAESKKKEGTLRNEKLFAKNWILPSFGDRILRQITDDDTERLDKEMNDAGCSPRTRQYCLGTVRYMINFAIRKKLYDGHNPVYLMDKPQVSNQRTRWLREDEAKKLLNALKKENQDLYDVALLSLHTGMRAGELHNMEWKHIDFENGNILIPEAKDAKKGSKVRYVFLTKEATEMLKRRERTKKSKYVFSDKKGGKRNQVPVSFRNIANKLFNPEGTAPADRVVFHTLRHSFASWQVQAGMDLYKLQTLLGHESLEMVKRYSHLSPDFAKEAVEVFDGPPEPEKEPAKDEKKEDAPKQRRLKVVKG